MVKLTPRLSRALQVLIALVSFVLPAFYWYGSAKPVNVNAIRELKLERLQVARAVGILRDHPNIVAEVNSSKLTLESLTLSLIEAVKQQSIKDNTVLKELSVEPLESVSVGANLYALRVKFSVELSSTMHVLPLFDAVKFIAQWRPVEVRQCNVIRKNAQPTALSAACSIDVYYFPDVDQ